MKCQESSRPGGIHACAPYRYLYPRRASAWISPLELERQASTLICEGKIMFSHLYAGPDRAVNRFPQTLSWGRVSSHSFDTTTLLGHVRREKIINRHDQTIFRNIHLSIFLNILTWIYFFVMHTGWPDNLLTHIRILVESEGLSDQKILVSASKHAAN